jgi:alpha-tubulin suppressor-like RCC1 family protein
LGNVAKIACGENHDLALVIFGAPYFDVDVQHPASHVGENVFMLATGGGNHPIGYQWLKNGSPILGANSQFLQLTNVLNDETGSYSIQASNMNAVVSSAETNLEVLTTPYFFTPVQIQTNSLPGASLALSASVTGEQPLAFHAQLNEVNMTDGDGVSGTTTSSVQFNPATYQDDGILSLIVTNSFGAFTGLVANVVISPVTGWGDNTSGQLLVPASVTNITALACGGDHNLALLTDGTVVPWGDNSYGQNSLPPSINQVVAIAEGDTHSLALRLDGSVIAWGDNSLGQTNVPGTVQNAIAVAAGTGFSQAVMPDGSVIQWGGFISLPYQFTNVMQISTRGDHSVALRSDGVVVDNLFSPAGYSNVICVCAGVNDSLALQIDGSLVAWGRSLNGQTNIPAPAQNVVAIAAGDDHFMALRSDGVVVAWGSTNYSQTKIPVLTQTMCSIAAGSVHSLAVLGQPFQRTAKAGESVAFSFDSPAGRLATYQWQFNGANIPGATNSTFTLGNVCWTNSGVYRVKVSNPVGTVMSPAMTLSVPPLRFAVVAFESVGTNGALHIQLTGSSGQHPVSIYRSSNLLDWLPIFTNAPTTGAIDFTDLPPCGLLQQFYRAIEQP